MVYIFVEVRDIVIREIEDLKALKFAETLGNSLKLVKGKVKLLNF